jgi:hypothetical protein
MKRYTLYLILATLLGIATLAAATSVNSINLSEPSVLELWLFFVPMSILSPNVGGPGTVLSLWVAVYAVQYLALICIVGMILTRLNKPKGPAAERAFDRAAALYYGAPAGPSSTRP